MVCCCQGVVEQQSMEDIQIAPHEYNQWQRKKIPSAKEQALSSSDEECSFVIRNIERKQKKIQTERRHHSCTSRGHHRVGSSVPKEGDGQREQRDTLKELKVLNLLVKSRRKALQSYLTREEALMEENAQMHRDIEQHEEKVHGEVTSLLQKYERYRGAVTTLTSKFEREKAQAEEKLQNAVAFTKQEIVVLNHQLKKIDEDVKAKREQLSMLLSYKDREYPVRAMHISHLQKRIDTLKQQHKRQLCELKSMVMCERDQYHQQLEDRVQGMKHEAATNVMDGLQDEIKEMAAQNVTLRKEIEDHLAEKSSMKEMIPALQREIGALKIDPRTDIRKQMFPHLYQEWTKCMPDTDVVLDIPTNQQVIL